MMIEARKRRLAICTHDSFRKTNRANHRSILTATPFALTACRRVCCLPGYLPGRWLQSFPNSISLNTPTAARTTTSPDDESLEIVLLVLLLAVDQERKPERVLCGLAEN